jgi:hypothetical protein
MTKSVVSNWLLVVSHTSFNKRLVFGLKTNNPTLGVGRAGRDQQLKTFFIL